jgi:hypothetical protein
MVTYITIGIKSTNTELINQIIQSYLLAQGEKFGYKFLPDLEENKGWITFVVDDAMESLDNQFLEYLSKKIQTVVMGYEHIDTVNHIHISTFDNGFFQDELSVMDFEVSDKLGHFSLVQDEFEDMGDINKLEEDYFNKLGYHPKNVDLQLLEMERHPG